MISFFSLWAWTRDNLPYGHRVYVYYGAVEGNESYRLSPARDSDSGPS